MESMLSPEQQQDAWRLVRTCDAYDLLWKLLEAADREGYYSEDDRHNARDELRIRREDAATALAQFKRKHGIPEE